jgi:hypothetical protein
MLTVSCVIILSEMTVVSGLMATTLEVKHGVPESYGLKSERVVSPTLAPRVKPTKMGSGVLPTIFH